MRITVIIPARMDSKRFPNKPLAPIVGVSGEAKSLIQRTWDVGIASGLETIIATDSKAIAEHAAGFGAAVRMTSDFLRNGTERCAAAALALGMRDRDVVINLQGDACLTPPEWLAALAYHYEQDLGHITPVEHIVTMVADFGGRPREDEVVAFSNVYGVAHRFSRYDGCAINRYTGRHFGVYAYRVGALREYLACPETPLEQRQGLEQQRWFHLGIPVKLLWSEEGVRLPECEVNEPGDIRRVEKELSRWRIE